MRSPAATEAEELTTTAAPSAARRRAVASPMPLDAPGTVATWPASAPPLLRRRPRLPVFGGALHELAEQLDQLLRRCGLRFLDRVFGVLELQQVELGISVAHARCQQAETLEVRDDLGEHH